MEDRPLRQIFNLDNTEHITCRGGDIVCYDDLGVMSIPMLPCKVTRPLFAMCTAGSARLMANLQEYTIHANELVTLRPGHILHGYEPSGDFRGIFLLVSNKVADELLPDITAVLPVVMDFRQSPVLQLSQAEATSLSDFHRFLWHKLRTVDGPYGTKELNSLLLSIYYEVLSIYKRHLGDFDKLRCTRNEETFYKFYSLLEKHYRSERSVIFYAESLCISPKHLSMVVKKVSGRTASEWIDDYVTLEAKQMLRASTLTVQEVSRELNFANQSFFGKYFKKHTGFSPSEYRAQSMV